MKRGTREEWAPVIGAVDHALSAVWEATCRVSPHSRRLWERLFRALCQLEGLRFQVVTEARRRGGEGPRPAGYGGPTFCGDAEAWREAPARLREAELSVREAIAGLSRIAPLVLAGQLAKWGDGVRSVRYRLESEAGR
jgi:hypothetical protein